MTNAQITMTIEAPRPKFQSQIRNSAKKSVPTDARMGEMFVMAGEKRPFMAIVFAADYATRRKSKKAKARK